MRSGTSWIDEVRARADLMEVAARYTKLVPAGKDYKGLCPLHQEKTPSFFVVPAKGFFKCFGCGESGDVFTLVMKAERVDFLEAARRLANWTGVEIERRRPRRRTEAEKERLQRQRELRRNVACDSWQVLGIDAVLDLFGIGREVVTNDEFLLLPIFTHGDVPRAWFRYRIQWQGDTVRPIWLGLDRSSDDLGNGLFVPPDLRTQLVRDSLVLVDDPLTVVRLRALGYGAAVAPYRSLIELADTEPWLDDEALQFLASCNVREIYLLVPLGLDRSVQSQRMRVLHALEVMLVRHGIEPILVRQDHFDRSWDWVASLSTSDQVRDLLQDEACVIDLFQLRVAAVVRGLSCGTLDQTMAIQKLQPVLAAADASGDRALYHAYVAWAARALGIKERQRLVRFRPEVLATIVREEAAEVF